MKLTIEFAKSKCLITIWSTKTIPIVGINSALQKRLFSVPLQFGPYLIHDQFSLTHFRHLTAKNV